jgi:ribosomal protein L35
MIRVEEEQSILSVKSQKEKRRLKKDSVVSNLENQKPLSLIKGMKTTNVT